jgi:Chalcone isomerase-like
MAYRPQPICKLICKPICKPMDSHPAPMSRMAHQVYLAHTPAQAPMQVGLNAHAQPLICTRRKAMWLGLGLPCLVPLSTQAQTQSSPTNQSGKQAAQAQEPETTQIGRTPATTSPPWPELMQLGSSAKLWGRHRFRHWGFHVYDAQLWVRTGFDATRALAHPMALSLVYARDIKAQDLADRSLQEIQRQTTFSATQSRQWSELMLQAFVDVRAGDRLTGIYNPTDRATFFHNGRATLECREAQFVPLFFGIWLSAQTSQPRMRRALLRLGDASGADRDA